MNLSPFVLIPVLAVIVTALFILWTMLALSGRISRDEERQEMERGREW